MRNLRIGRLLVIGVAAVVLALLPFQLSGYHQTLASRVALYFIAILGLNILTGYTGISSDTARS
jgi:ABC-type branched-subunit amino acid transport system permease subunit